MIRYALKCSEGHAFESWFQSAAAFDSLHDKGLLSCAVCGESSVEKSLMAPKVGASAGSTEEMEKKIAAYRKKVESEATYVGGRFAAEVRAIHGTEDDRAIYGEANGAEVRALLEDGIPIAPLPFRPRAKSH